MICKWVENEIQTILQLQKIKQKKYANCVKTFSTIKMSFKYKYVADKRNMWNKN